MSEERVVLYNVTQNESGSFDWTWVVVNTYSHYGSIRDRILKQAPPIGGITEARTETSGLPNFLRAFSISYESYTPREDIRRHGIHRRVGSMIADTGLGDIVDHRQLRTMFPSLFPSKRE